MTRSIGLLLLSGLVLAVCAPLSSAHAQATRTWVSGVGDDANPCSRTAPCKTFAGAISKTAAAGEINVLDPGGFGALTITKSISIIDDGVGEAGVLVSGTNGITISAAATDKVILRGLIIDGLNASPNGVQINTAANVSIQNCVIMEFNTGAGVAVTPNTNNVMVQIQDSTMTLNGSGVLVLPTGGATATLSIEHTRIVNNSGGGFKADGTGGGVPGGTVKGALSDSTISLNASNGVNGVSGSSGNVRLNLTRDVISSNALVGIQANQSSGGAVGINVDDTSLSNNGTAINSISGGQVLSYGNNQTTGAAGTGFTGSLTLN
jgi:hypothetical protein